jgi:hypothetical protein
MLKCFAVVREPAWRANRGDLGSRIKQLLVRREPREERSAASDAQGVRARPEPSQPRAQQREHEEAGLKAWCKMAKESELRDVRTLGIHVQRRIGTIPKATCNETHKKPLLPLICRIPRPSQALV